MLKFISDEDKQSIDEGREQTLEDALRGFESLDLNDDGYVEKHDLFEMTKQCMDLTDDDVNEFFTTFDIKRDGRVSKSEWEKVFVDLYDSHILAGLEATFREAFPGNK